MLYTIAGVLVVASAQSVRSSGTAYYVMMGIGILVCAIGLFRLLKSNNG